LQIGSGKSFVVALANINTSFFICKSEGITDKDELYVFSSIPTLEDLF